MGLSVLQGITVTAKAVHRMSAFSRITSKILGAASLAGKAGSMASLAVHGAQIAGNVINGLEVTKAVGRQVANLMRMGLSDRHYIGFGPPLHWKYRGLFYPPHQGREMIMDGIISVATAVGDIAGIEKMGFAGDISDIGGIGHRQLPIVGMVSGNNTIKNTELWFTVSEQQGYKGIKNYIERMQKKASLKFSAVYLPQKEAERLLSEGKLSIQGRTIYGSGSSFPKNPNLNRHVEAPYKYLLYFSDSYVSHSGVVRLKYTGLVPIE